MKSLKQYSKIQFWELVRFVFDSRLGSQVTGECNVRKVAASSKGLEGQKEEESLAHLTDLYESSSINLSEDEADIFKDLLWNYRDVFSKDE